MTCILLADDHTLIRSAMKIVIQNLILNCDVEEAGNGDEAFQKAKEKDFSLIILDVNMPDTDSFSLVSNILALKPYAKILMYSMNPEEIFAKRYLKMGVMGYLRKDADEQEIRKAITTVLNNKKYISSRLAENLVEDAFNEKAGNPFDKLSPREFEVVQHIIHGKSTAQICEQLHINSSTASSHKKRIFEKLGVSNTIEINQMAKAYNIV